MSPVESQPSSSIVSAVFSGRLRYPRMLMSPLTSTSPSAAILISTPGSGGPTVPIFTRSAGVPAPALLGAELLDRGLEALLDRLALLVGEPVEHGLEAGLELLPDAGNGEEPGRANGRQELDDLPGIGADRDLDALGDRQVVVRAAL